MKVVGVWGSYEHGNFGDDLMAILFARHLRAKGWHPLIFRLDDTLAIEEGFEVTHDLDRLVSEATCLVIGGGGMLVPDSYLRILVRHVARSFELDFVRLHSALTKHKKVIHPISIGGSGGTDDTSLPLSRERFFSSSLVGNGTVRLKSDLNFSSRFPWIKDCFPDILLSTKLRYPIDSVSRQKIVAINLPKNKIEVARSYHKHFISLGYQVVYLQTHLPAKKHGYELTSADVSDLPSVDFTHSSFRNTLEFLSSMYAIFSSKLHIGLVANTFGTPFYALCAKSKARAYLETSGQPDRILPDSLSPNFVPRSFDSLLLHRLQEQSESHWLFLDSVMESYN